MTRRERLARTVALVTLPLVMIAAERPEVALPLVLIALGAVLYLNATAWRRSGRGRD